MTAAAQPAARRPAALAAAVGVTGLLVFLLAGATLWQSRGAALKELALAVEHDTHILAKHADGVFLHIDTLLSSAAFGWENHGVVDSRFVAFFARQLPEGGCLSMLGPTAELIHSTCPAPARHPPIVAEDFRDHAERRAITALSLRGPADSLRMSRAVIGRDGRFLGVLAATFRASALLSNHAVGAHREQWIVSPDAQFISTTSFGAPLEPSSEAAAAVRALVRHDNLTAVRLESRGKLIAAGVQLRSQPLVAVVGGDTDLILRDWRRSLAGVGVALAIGMAGAVVLLGRLRRAERARARAQAEADQRKALLDTVVANAPIGIWMSYEDGQRPMVNRTFAEWTGWHSGAPSLTREELLTCAKSDALAAQCSVPVLVDEVITFADGCRHTLQVAKQRVLDADGALIGVIGVGQDITGRKRAEETLRAMASRLDAILNNAPVGIAISSENAHLELVNPRMVEIFRTSESALLGGSAMALFSSPEDCAAFGERVLPVIRRGGTAGEELRMRRGDGTLFWASIVGHLVAPEDPSLGIVWAVADITEHRAVEEELAVHAAELHRSNAELEAFAYAASHDLRQPLRSIVSYLTLLERHLAGQLDQDTSDFLGFARDGAKRMDRLIIDLLEYSRVGRRAKLVEDCPVANVAETAMVNLRAAIEEAKAQVILQPGLPEVRGDPGELVRLFQNLIGNAVKYRAEGRPPVIEIACRPEGRHWHFTVTDNGIGIAPDQCERVFGIFQRLHTASEYEGTGIGLALCKKIVESHDGRIWVESQPDSGSAFHFTLPNREGAVS